jgi:hypothetical protein
VKLAQRYYLDPAVRALPAEVADAAEVMFTRGLARAGEVARGGFIPEQDVELLTRRRRHGAVVNALISSGLWQAVPGGYQVTRWADWQDHLDALTRKRAVDRERQRRRRAAARNGNPLSRDKSRDVTAVEGEGELEGVQVGGEAHPPRGQTRPPPGFCPKHQTQPADGPCGPCGDYRRVRLDWDSAQAAAQQQARHEAVATARASPRCSLCGTRHRIGDCPITREDSP